MKKLIEYLSSPARARRVLWVYWALLTISTHMPDPGLGGDSNPFGVFQIDKALHVVAFAGLAYLLFRARVAGIRSSLFVNALGALVIAVVYALVDEYTQRWTGRIISSGDVVAGMIGIVLVFLMATSPPARQRATRPVKAVRLVAALAIISIIVMALAPQGNQWFNRMAQPLFHPWPGIDKAGHYYVSVVLTLLLAASYPAGVHRPRRGILLTIVAMGLSGPIIETAQSFTGRSVEMADLYAHELGLLTAMLGLSVFAVGRAVKTRRNGRTHQDG